MVTRIRIAGVLLAAAGWMNAEEPKAVPDPVAVGGGSYAAFPPWYENYQQKGDTEVYNGRIDKVLSKSLYIDESQKGRPIPTNDWWTNLITDRYGGNLWANPLVLRPDELGFKIHYPLEWNDKGTNMELGPALAVRGEILNEKPEWILIADFEGQKFPDGWRTDGEAFGKGPTTGAMPGQTRVQGYMGSGLANSIHGGDNAVGQLTSPPFKIDRNFLHFQIAGGRLPDTNRVELLGDDNKVLASATGENSEELKWRTIDVAQWKGKQAKIRLKDDAQGGWAHLLVDQIILSDQPTPPLPGFHPESATALRWGDWTVTSRMADARRRGFDVTFGQGMPLVWIESNGVAPAFELMEQKPDATDFYGKPLTFPANADGILLHSGGRIFAIMGPEGSRFESIGSAVRLTVKGAAPLFAVVGAMSRKEDALMFARFGFAIPRDSRFDWKYDSSVGQVATHWVLSTQALRGANLDVIQGWIPHHYRATQNSLKFVGAPYATPRGALKLTTGREFDIGWSFNGIPPMLPAPAGSGSYSKERMKGYLAAYTNERVPPDGDIRYGSDTYWGAKDLIQFTQYATIAKLTGNTEEYSRLLSASRVALSDWFTYTKNERERYFARYDGWKALIGFKPSYGSEQFTDNHFHYGYFTLSAALLGMLDPTFLKNYAPMARLVAKQYANWDRNDLDFPFLRTFNPWSGRSYAGGMSSVIGNNQESSSEAMQSWGGLFLLGVATEDADMTAAGAMGWSIERSAVEEYWNDYYGWKSGPGTANFPAAYGKTIVGILGDQGMAFGTFFHGHPKFVYGIQWLPLSTSLYYLGKDPAFGRFQFDTMFKEQEKVEAGFSLSKFGADWGDVVLGYEQFFDPEATCKKLDALWEAKDEVATNKNLAGLVYYFAHADRDLGAVAWDLHTSLPGSLVYQKPGAATVTVVGFTPKAPDFKAKLFRGNLVLAEFDVTPGEINQVEISVSK